MGAYLSEPNKKTHSADNKSDRFTYGASSMQGWRMSNEDAHSCILDYDKDSSLFAVFDGHGGAEVAIYTADRLPKYIKQHRLYTKGEIEEALKESFIEFDLRLRDASVTEELTEIAEAHALAEQDEDEDDEQPGPSGSCPTGPISGPSGSGSSSTSRVNGRSTFVDDIDTAVLKQEAELPIEEILRKYCADKNSSRMIPLFKNLIAKRLDPNRGIPNSPMVKSAQTQKGAASSSSSDSKNCNISVVGGDTTQESAVENTNKSSNETAEEHDSSTTSKSNSISSDEPNGSSPPKREISTDEEMASVDQKLEEGTSQGSSSDHEKTRLALSLLMSSGEDEDSSEGSDFDSEDFDSSNDDDDDDGDDEDDDDAENSMEAVRHRVRKFKRKAKDDNRDSDDDEEEDGDQDEEDKDEDEDEDGQQDDEDEDEDADEDEDGESEWEEEELGIQHSHKYSMTPGKDSGCTAVVALFRENTLYVANAGDSRCVLCRDGKAVDMSLDHKPEDQIEHDRIYRAGGRITEDGRVNGGLNLSRAIGDYSYKNNTTLQYREQMITALPDVKKCEIDPKTDTFVVLACDGIWNSMSSQEVVGFIKNRIDKTEKLSSICEELFHHCIAKDTSGDGTGCDNMTCIIVRIDENTIHKEDDLEKDEQTKGNMKRKCDEESELPKKKECA